MPNKVPQLSATPTPQSEDEPSIVEPEIIAAVTAGEDTKELSDISEGYEDSVASTKGSKSLKSWYIHRLSPLIRNKLVRTLSIINFIILTINLLMLLIVIVLCFAFLALFIKQKMLSPRDMPCLYDFKPWSECSASCWAKDEGAPMPKKWRELDEEKLVMGRGSFAKCPENLRAGLIQYAPCNVHKCPEKLSSFTKWTRCFHKNPLLRKAGGCYKIRKLPDEDDRLIYVDITDFTRDCPDKECPDLIP